MAEATVQSTRSGILDAADELFGAHGFHATTTREIAAACGVNKALIHYHFAGKDDLFAAVLERYYDRLDEVLRGALASHGRLRDRLWRVVDAYADFLATNDNFSRMVQREAAGGAHLERIVDRMLPIFARGVELLEAALPATRRGPLAARDLLISFYGMIVTYFTYGPVLEELLDSSPATGRNLARRKRHLRRMLDLVLDAVEDQPLPRRKRGGTKEE